MGHAMLYNPRLELGLLISFDLTEMPNLTEWKMMGEGSYVLGLEPCNCRTLGRAVERERGALREILPGEVKTTKVVFTVLDGAASAKDAMQKFNR